MNTSTQIYTNYTINNDDDYIDDDDDNVTKNTILIYFLLAILSTFLLIFLVMYFLIICDNFVRVRNDRIGEIRQRYGNNIIYNNRLIENIELVVETPKSISLDLIMIDNCSICFEDFKNKSKVFTDCEHVFHESCIREWKITNNNLNREFRCPLCRDIIEKTYKI